MLEVNSQQVLITEKAKSEFLLAPILYEIARRNQDKISFFSGHNFDVDKTLGLKGFCDFLFAKVPKTPIIKEPVFCPKLPVTVTLLANCSTFVKSPSFISVLITKLLLRNGLKIIYNGLCLKV